MKSVIKKLIQAIRALTLSNDIYTAPPVNIPDNYFLIDNIIYSESGAKDRFITNVNLDISAVTSYGTDNYTITDSLDMIDELQQQMKANRDSTLDLGSDYEMILVTLEDSLQTINQTETEIKVYQTLTYNFQIEQN